MFSTRSDELIQIEDIFENDEYVLMKAIFFAGNKGFTETSVGIKNKTGDIEKIVCVDRYENQQHQHNMNKGILDGCLFLMSERILLIPKK